MDDTAEKLGVNPCTVRRQIQTARNLTPEAKKIIKESETKLSKKAALKLSRLEPEQQKEAMRTQKRIGHQPCEGPDAEKSRGRFCRGAFPVRGMSTRPKYILCTKKDRIFLAIFG